MKMNVYNKLKRLAEDRIYYHNHRENYSMVTFISIILIIIIYFLLIFKR